MEIRWNEVKNRRLKKVRGVSFEEILAENLIGDFKHPIHPNQHVLLFERKGYVWVVPYVIENDGIFLKTLFPSRKYTKLYRKGGTEK